MPTEAMLRPRVVIPNDRTTYAQEFITGLSPAHKYMSDITKELQCRQKKYYDIGRCSIQFNIGDYVIVHQKPHSKTSCIATKWLSIMSIITLKRMFSNCLNECGQFKVKHLYCGVGTFWGLSGGIEVYTFVLKLMKKIQKSTHRN